MDLADSLDEEVVKSELPTQANSSASKLSNFMPENLRKSFRERRERLNTSVDREQAEVGANSVMCTTNNSPNIHQQLSIVVMYAQGGNNSLVVLVVYHRIISECTMTVQLLGTEYVGVTPSYMTGIYACVSSREGCWYEMKLVLLIKS